MTVRLLVKSPVSFTNTFTVITALDFAEIFVMTQVIVWPSTASFSTNTYSSSEYQTSR